MSQQAKKGKLGVCFSTHLKLLPNIKKWGSFIENASWKMTCKGSVLVPEPKG